MIRQIFKFPRVPNSCPAQSKPVCSAKWRNDALRYRVFVPVSEGGSFVSCGMFGREQACSEMNAGSRAGMQIQVVLHR
jgi:hypothetical protein